MIRWASKIVHEWNGHLEIFSQVKENSRQNLLLRTDILQKTVVGCPWPELWKTTIGLIAAHFFVHFLAVVYAKPVRGKGGMSLRNGIWHGLRKDYAKKRPGWIGVGNKLNRKACASLPSLVWRQIWRSNRQATIETQLIHQIGSLFIITLEGKKRSLKRTREVEIATILGILSALNP